MAIRQLQKDGFLKTKGRIALIVDSDLPNLSDLNSRKIPVTDDFYLPESIDLLYASSDTGNEYCPNKLFRMADRIANEVGWLTTADRFRILAGHQSRPAAVVADRYRAKKFKRLF